MANAISMKSNGEINQRRKASNGENGIEPIWKRNEMKISAKIESVWRRIMAKIIISVGVNENNETIMKMAVMS